MLQWGPTDILTIIHIIFINQYLIMRIFPAIAAAALMASVSATASADTFSITENFDDASHFTESQYVPDGWSRSEGNPSRRAEGIDYFGVWANTGDYVYGVSTGRPGYVTYTKPFSIKGNTPASISFYAMAPGGNPAILRSCGWKIYAGTTADISQMDLIGTKDNGVVSDWTFFEYSFTPSADGEYYYAIELTTTDLAVTLGGGSVLFDSFIFEGTVPGGGTGDMSELEPDSENLADCMPLPYIENFSDASHYDGTSNLPRNWVSVGTHPFVTANIPSLTAQDGEYYMTTVESTEERDERAFTPFYNLEAGTEYSVSFYTHFEGHEVAEGVWRRLALDVTLGTQQDSDFHPVTLGTVSRELDEVNTWEYSEFKFTPLVSGPYCLSFKLDGAPLSGTMALDNLIIMSASNVPAPMPNFYTDGLYELMESNLLAFENHPVRFVNTTRFGETYSWSAEDCQVTELPDGSADIIFPAAGEYDITLTATNASGSQSETKTVSVSYIKDSEITGGVPMLSYNPATSRMLNDKIPTLGTDEYDYISGFNNYYRSYAERFDVAPGIHTTINSISLWVFNLNYRPMSAITGDQRECSFTATVYGADEEGNLDETKVFGTFTKQMQDVFGRTGLGGGFGLVPVSVEFTEPIVAKGPFYIAFTYDDALETTALDPYLGRSYLGLAMCRNASGKSGFYVKPTAVTDKATCNADGNWHGIAEMDPSFAGIDNTWTVWSNFGDPNTGVAINSVGETVLAARFNGNVLTVSGTKAGESVAVYDLQGRNVLIATGDDNATVIPASLPAGLYIINTNSGSIKIMK